jgi:hypothetical protein
MVGHSQELEMTKFMRNTGTVVQSQAPEMTKIMRNTGTVGHSQELEMSALLPPMQATIVTSIHRRNKLLL